MLDIKKKLDKCLKMLKNNDYHPFVVLCHIGPAIPVDAGFFMPIEYGKTKNESYFVFY